MRMRKLALAISVTLLWAGAAGAQPRPGARSIDERLGELSARVDEAMRAAADSTAALKALQDLQRQLTELRQQAERQKDVVRGYEETRRALEQTESRLGSTELQLAALKLEIEGHGRVAGYRDGFYLQTPTQRFLLRFNGLIQGGYEGRIFAENRYPSDGALGKNESSFLLRHAAMAFSGHVFLRDLTYGLELDFGSEDPGPLLEGWADLALHRSLRLRAGKQKIPVGRQLLLPSSRLEFAGRSGPVRAFAPGWDLGAMLHGELPIKGGLAYQLGIFNGAAPGALQNDNLDLLYAVRLTAEPLGRLVEGEGDVEKSPFRFALGGSFAFNLAPTDVALRKGVTDPTTVARLTDKDADGNVDNVAVYTVGAELSLRYAGASLQSELFYRREDPGRIAGDEALFGSHWGVYGQLGYFLPFLPGMEVAARFSYWEPPFYGESRSAYRPGKVTELGAVVNLLMWRRLLKWQLEYDHQWQRDLNTTAATFLGGANVSLVRLQVQAAF